MAWLGHIAALRAAAHVMTGVLALLLLVPSAGAQQQAEPTATARVAKTPVIVDTPFTFTIEVSGADDAERPDLAPLVRGIEVSDAGRGQQTSLTTIGGRMVSTTTVEFHYMMTVRQPGEYVIPPVPVRAGARTLRTNEVRFEAGVPPKTDDFQVRIEVDRTNPYVGQPITIRMTMYTTSDIAMPRVQAGGDFGRFDATDAPGWTGNARGAVPFLGGEVVPTVGSGMLDARAYKTVELARRLIPRESGPATLGPITVSTQFMERVRQGLFESTRAVRNVSARSGTIELDVRPLPLEGRPEIFTGLVGRYEAHADAQPTDVNVGDPITLNVLVTGGPLIDDVRLPDLASLPGFEGRLRVSADEPARMPARGGMLLTVSVRPLSDAVDSIPPIEIAYFDPEEEAYRVARTAAIPLRVRPTRRVTAMDAVGAAPLSGGAQVESARAGIAHNDESPDALRPVPTSVLAELRSPVWVASIAAPPLAYALCAAGLAIRRRGERTGGARRRSRALGRAREMLRGAERPEDIVAGVGTYFEMASGRPRASVTPADVEEEAAPVAPDAAARLRAILERCDAARFAGVGVEDVRSLRAEAESLLREIDPGLRRRRGA